MAICDIAETSLRMSECIYEQVKTIYICKGKEGGGHLLKGACYWELVVIVVKTVTAFEYYSKTEAQIPMMIKVHADLQLNSYF